MKTIYFLRHGQTELNRVWVHQFPATHLSNVGHEQASAAGEHFKDSPLDVIVTSDLTRAQETAKDIAAVTGTNIVSSDLFVELRRPRRLWGVSWAHPKTIWIMGLLYLFAGRPHWHYADEENLEEFHARARRALEYLANRPEQNMLVITHKGFMANLWGRMKHDGMDTIAQYRRALWKNLTIGNCCYLKATWTNNGVDDYTLAGTWDVDGRPTCTS